MFLSFSSLIWSCSYFFFHERIGFRTLSFVSFGWILEGMSFAADLSFCNVQQCERIRYLTSCLIFGSLGFL